jgi:unsaturated rhamnogalacturonyl hydrolase
MPLFFAPARIGVCRTLFFAFLLLVPAGFAQTNLPDAASVIAAMRLANNYWINNNALGNSGWANSSYYTGNQRAARVLSDSNFLARSLNWAVANNWQVGPEAGGNTDADSQCSGQTYIDLYRMDRQPNRITSIRQRLDLLVATNRVDQWWWIDAFHMAAPSFARMGNLTGDTNYFHKEFLMYDDMKTRLGLFDPTVGLWYRDANYIYPKAMTTDSNKVFWSRGEGWVICGLARCIEQMPTNAPERTEFVSMFQTMAAALKPLQGSDGMWRSSLLAPQDFPTPETSGTVFFVYAFAWGVRNGYLNAADYTNSIALGWYGLTNIALQPSGRIGYVQAVGQKPGIVNSNDTAAYAVGGFLLAGSELLLMNSNSPSISACAGGDETVNDVNRDGHELVTLDGSATEIYKGTAAFTWWTNGLPAATGMVAQIDLPLGSTLVILQVLGSDGITYTDSVVKTVAQIQSIVANAGPDDYVRDIDRNGEATVTLNGSGTVVQSGTALSYDWWLGNTWLASGVSAQTTLPHGRYTITLRVLDSDLTTATDTVVKVVEPYPIVTASGTQSPNWPSNTIDGNLATRWSDDGVGQFITYDLGQSETVSGVDISFLSGNVRRSYFTVNTSLNGTTWTLQSTNASSGTTTNLEHFAISPVTARYVRIINYGNDQNTFASYQEVAIIAQLLQTDSDGDGLPDAWETARLGNLSGGATNDTDLDGMTSLAEYLVGTDPAVSNAPLSLTLTGLASNSLRVTFPTRAALGPGYTGLNRHYSLESSSQMPPDAWTAVPGWEDIIGNNLAASGTLNPTNGACFFRLRAWLQ